MMKKPVMRLFVVHGDSPTFGDHYSEVECILEAPDSDTAHKFVDAVYGGLSYRVAEPPRYTAIKGTKKQMREHHDRDVQRIYKAERRAARR